MQGTRLFTIERACIAKFIRHRIEILHPLIMAISKREEPNATCRGADAQFVPPVQMFFRESAQTQVSGLGQEITVTNQTTHMQCKMATYGVPAESDGSGRSTTLCSQTGKPCIPKLYSVPYGPRDNGIDGQISPEENSTSQGSQEDEE